MANYEAKRTSDILLVPCPLFEVTDGLNLREDYKDMKQLIDSIRENGVKVPVKGFIKNGVYTVVHGHRRLKACQWLYEHEQTVISLPFMRMQAGISDEQIIVEMFLTNEGEPLTPLEQAEGVNRLINHGWTVKEIAVKLSRSSTYIDSLYQLSQAPKKAKTAVKKGLISGTTLIQLIKKGDVNQFIADHETFISNQQPATELFEDTKPKTKQAAITKTDLSTNSVKLFKQFSKKTPEFGSKAKENCYWFCVDIISNKLSLTDIENYFKDGK